MSQKFSGRKPRKGQPEKNCTRGEPGGGNGEGRHDAKDKERRTPKPARQGSRRGQTVVFYEGKVREKKKGRGRVSNLRQEGMGKKKPRQHIGDRNKTPQRGGRKIGEKRGIIKTMKIAGPRKSVRKRRRTRERKICFKACAEEIRTGQKDKNVKVGDYRGGLPKGVRD